MRSFACTSWVCEGSALGGETSCEGSVLGSGTSLFQVFCLGSFIGAEVEESKFSVVIMGSDMLEWFKEWFWELCMCSSMALFSVIDGSECGDVSLEFRVGGVFNSWSIAEM